MNSQCIKKMTFSKIIILQSFECLLFEYRLNTFIITRDNEKNLYDYVEMKDVVNESNLKKKKCSISSFRRSKHLQICSDNLFTNISYIEIKFGFEICETK